MVCCIQEIFHLCYQNPFQQPVLEVFLLLLFFNNLQVLFIEH